MLLLLAGLPAAAAQDTADLCAAPLALAKDGVPVAVDRGPVRAVAAFPIKGAPPADVRGRVVWARRGDAAVPIPGDIGAVGFDEARRAVTVDIPVATMRPGEWSFGVDVMRTVGSKDARVECPEERLDVKVSVAAPALAVSPASVAWEVVWPWDVGAAAEPRVVQLTETAGAAGVHALSDAWVPLARRSGAASPLAVDCGPAEGVPARAAPSATAGAAASIGVPAEAPADHALPGGIVAGGVQTLSCALSGIELGGPSLAGLGAQTGTLRLDAPSLLTPVAVPVTVTTRLTKLFIPVLILAAIALSRLLREGLHAKVAALEAKDRAERALVRANAARASSADEDFRAAVDEAVRVFTDGLLDTVEGAEIDKKIKTLDESVATAEAALKVVTEEAARDVQSLEKALLPPWRLPPELQRPLATARAATANARAALAGRNPTRALREVGAAKVGTADLGTAASTFLDTVQPLLDAPLPPVKPLVGVLARERASIAGSATDTYARLLALHVAWEPLERGLAEALAAARRDLVAAIEVFADQQEAGQALLARLPSLRARPVPDTLAERVRLHQVLAQEAAALRKALTEAMGTRSTVDVVAALDAGEWGRAVTLAGTSGADTLGGRSAERPESASAPAEPVATNIPAAAVPPVEPWSPVWAGLGDGRPTRQALDDLRGRSFWITTTAITLLGATQFSGGWVGTWEDLTAAFAWGLGLDASAAFLFGLAAEVRTKSGKAWPAPPAASESA